MKYIVDYTNGATGYGWRQEYNRLEDFEEFVNEMRTVATAYVTVWDTELKAFVYRKGYGFKPDVDMLRNIMRDMRTTTRTRKEVSV